MAHPMTQLFEREPAKLIALMLWTLRAKIKNFEVELTEQDVRDFTLAIEAFGGAPQVTLHGKTDRIVVGLVDLATGRRMQADPTLNENSPEAQRMARSMAARERAPVLLAEMRAAQAPEAFHASVAECMELLEALT